MPVENSARPELHPGADQLGVAEHGLGVVRRIVRRRDAEREVGQERPAGLREDAVPFAADVRVRVDDARHDRLAAHVDLLRAGRDRDAAADGGDAVAFDDDGAVLDDGVAGAR